MPIAGSATGHFEGHSWPLLCYRVTVPAGTVVMENDVHCDFLLISSFSVRGTRSLWESRMSTARDCLADDDCAAR